MNYVAFVGVLAIDNDFMNIQAKNHKNVNKWIENVTDHPEFKLYKSPKFHDRKQLSNFLTRILFGAIKFFYKVIYFYVTPIFIVLISFLGYNAWAQHNFLQHYLKKHKDLNLKDLKFDFMEDNLVPIDKEQIQVDYLATITNDMYLAGVWIFFAILFASLEVTHKHEHSSGLIKFASFIITFPWLIFVQYVGFKIMWPFWSGQYNIPGWIAWAYDLPIGLGYWNMIMLINGYFYAYAYYKELTDEIDRDSCMSYLKSVITQIPKKICGALFIFSGVCFATIGCVLVEWILYKTYILTILYYFFLYVIISVYTVPVNALIWCYSHWMGLTILLNLTVICFCLKHCLISKRRYDDFKKRESL